MATYYQRSRIAGTLPNMSDHPEVNAYLAAAPEEQRHVLERLRARIIARLPEAEEAFESRMPVYKVNGEWTAGFAYRKKGPMLYIMRPELLDEYALVLGRNRSGRTCIDMVATKRLSLAILENIADEILSRVGLGQSAAAGTA